MRYLILFMAALIVACAAAPALAGEKSEGVHIQVVNKTGQELTVELEVHGWEETRTIERSVADGGTLEFSKAETKHSDKEIIPSWYIRFHPNCRYQIYVKDGQCAATAGTASCALVEPLPETCGYRYTVAE